jgi:hypothetical protein
MRKTTCCLNLLVLALLLSANVPLRAGTLSVATVDTSSVAGANGFLDFTFDPGPLATQSAFAVISAFSSNGILGSPTTTGDVSGTLPPSITLNNDTLFNDFFIAFTFGNTLNFSLALGGPAVDSPDGISTSGSTFAFSMFSSDGSTPLLTADSLDGFAFKVDVNLDGTTKLTNFSDSTLISGAVSSVPEPASCWCFGGAIALCVMGGRHRALATH